MFREELICFTNNGINAVRITIVSSMIDNAQVQPEFGSMNELSNEWKPTRMPDTAQYSGVIAALSAPRKSSHSVNEINNAVIFTSNAGQAAWSEAGIVEADADPQQSSCVCPAAFAACSAAQASAAGVPGTGS